MFIKVIVLKLLLHKDMFLQTMVGRLDLEFLRLLIILVILPKVKK